jgi:DnaK suppressor protein
MDEKNLPDANDDEYMNAASLAFFDNKLVELYAQTRDEISSILDEITLGKVSDMNDRATIEEENAIALRLLDRKRKFLPKIDAARKRIKDGDYGYCLLTGDPIGIQRLLIRSTAEYCADAKQINEKRETRYEH